MKLQETIARLATRFASDVVQAVSEALSQTLDGVAASRVADGAARAAARRASRPAGRGRTREELLAVGEKVLTALAKHPAGVRAEVLREELGLTREAFQRPMTILIAEGRARKTGEKRRTTYFPLAGSGKAASAKSSSRSRKASSPRRKASAKKAAASEA